MASTLMIAAGTVILFLVSGGLYSILEFDGVWILPVSFFWLGVLDTFVQVPYFDTVIMGVLAIPILGIIVGLGVFFFAGDESQSADRTSGGIDLDGASKYLQSNQDTSQRKSTSTSTNKTVVNDSNTGSGNNTSQHMGANSQNADTAVYEPDQEDSDTKIYRD